jgi:hypothetical protein
VSREIYSSPYAKYITPIKRQNTLERQDSVHRDAIYARLSSNTFSGSHHVLLGRET